MPVELRRNEQSDALQNHGVGHAPPRARERARGQQVPSLKAAEVARRLRD
jgi:hypothetical protein